MSSVFKGPKMKRDPEGAGGESGVGRSQQLISKVPVALMRLKVVDNAEEDADAALRPPSDVHFN